MNILFTGVGRRVELIQAFRDAGLKLNIELKIYGADADMTAPALLFCDFTREICRMKDENYIPELMKICQEDKIDIVIPTIDTDLMILSQNKKKFEASGTKVLISDPEMIAICRDKNYTADFFRSCGLKAPETVNDYRKYKGSYPCFIKPKDGSSSINAFKVEDEKQLRLYAEIVEDYIIQPFVEGKEYTVDVFCDFDGNPITIIPRERIAIRAGEVLKTRIELEKKIIEEIEILVNKFKPCGPITVQLIRNEKEDNNYYIEINPRFGGGAPLSMKAGAGTAEILLKLVLGQKIERKLNGVLNHAVYSRFDQSVCIDSGEHSPLIKGVIFDLDDTLYPEKDYIMSGCRAIAKYIGKEEVADKLWSDFNSGLSMIDEYLIKNGKENLKTEYLNIYRFHIPSIHLYDGALEIIEYFKSHGIKVGIITDGRPEGQRNKIKALELDKLIEDIIITDELGGVQFRKPNDIAFRIMQCRWKLPFEQLIYVGDNIYKDFQAPRRLGIKPVWLKNVDGLYTCDNHLRDICMIKNIGELKKFIII